MTKSYWFSGLIFFLYFDLKPKLNRLLFPIVWSFLATGVARFLSRGRVTFLQDIPLPKDLAFKVFRGVYTLQGSSYLPHFQKGLVFLPVVPHSSPYVPGRI